jgi:hypothetical protein
MQKHSTLSSDQDESCIHHWIIDVKNVGICKKCGEIQQFCSSWEQATSGKTWTRNYGDTRNNTKDTEKQ